MEDSSRFSLKHLPMLECKSKWSKKKKQAKSHLFKRHHHSSGSYCFLFLCSSILFHLSQNDEIIRFASCLWNYPVRGGAGKYPPSPTIPPVSSLWISRWQCAHLTNAAQPAAAALHTANKPLLTRHYRLHMQQITITDQIKQQQMINNLIRCLLSRSTSGIDTFQKYVEYVAMTLLRRRVEQIYESIFDVLRATDKSSRLAPKWVESEAAPRRTAGGDSLEMRERRLFIHRYPRQTAGIVSSLIS